MLVTFGEIKNEVLSFLNIDSDNVDEPILTSIELRINQVQDFIFFRKYYEWRKRNFYLSTRPPEETGIITVTKGSLIITGSGTAFNSDMRLGYLLVGSKAYKINRINSTTELIIEAKYPDTTESNKSYKVIFPLYSLPFDITSIIAIKHEGIELDVKRQDALILDVADTGQPREASFGEILHKDFFNAGTVTVNQNNSLVTLTSGTLPADIVGLNFRVNEFSKSYLIQSRDSDTTFTLEENYEGDSGSGKSYTIDPKGTRLIRVTRSPDDFYFLEIEALVRAKKLINNTDYSLIPDHAPLISGAIWLAAIDRKNENPVRIQQARADFNRTLVQFDKVYKAQSNIRWLSEAEISIKKQGLTQFNPLKQDHHV